MIEEVGILLKRSDSEDEKNSSSGQQAYEVDPTC